MRRTRTLAGAVLCAGLALAACGGDDAPTGVASLGGSTTTTAKDGSGGHQSEADAVVDYVRCLRREGVDVADPQPVSDGDEGGPGFDGLPPDDEDGGAGREQSGAALGGLLGRIARAAAGEQQASARGHGDAQP